jgi:glycosyltransferase involved in cell wall biosynthesis
MLYVLGSHQEASGHILETMQSYPGVTVLHETLLEAPGRQSPEWIERIVSCSLGIIVHSSHARRRVRGRHPGCRVADIPVPFYLPSGFSFAWDRRALQTGWGLDGRFVVGTFEPFASRRQMDVCLRAFSNLLVSRPDASYLLCGAPPSGYDLVGLVQAVGLEKRVILTGGMDPISLSQHMGLVDLAVQLQPPSAGGASLVPTRLMGLGIPTIVSDVDQLAGFPEGACAKVRRGEYEEATLTAMLEHLARHDPERHQMARNGQQYVRAYCSPERIAEQILSFVHEIVTWAPGASWLARPSNARDLLLRDVGGILAEWGVTEEDDPLLPSVSRAIGDLFALPSQESD